jgi:cyclic pyranopterin phosphate synthase
MIDNFGRTIRGLRISLTQRCNLNCMYCHHEGEESSKVEMSTQEVLRILNVAANLGIKRVKFTGGEPLMRADLVDLIGGSISIGLEDVAITTNGSFLKPKAHDLAKAGLRHLNVSLPSTNPEVYRSITGGRLSDVLDGLCEARACGMELKLNVVIMKGVNVSEVKSFLALARSMKADLQLIELEDLNLTSNFFMKHHQDLSGIEAEIAKRAQIAMNRSDMNQRPRYILDGLRVDVVRPLNNPDFCSKCSRLRVTSDGKLKPCLMRSKNLDMLGPMRSGCTDSELTSLFQSSVGLRSPYYQKSPASLDRSPPLRSGSPSMADTP